MQSATTANFANAIATFFLVGVGVWGIIETHKALQLSRRAWVAPSGAAISAPLVKDKPIRFGVYLTNTGSEVGRDLNSRLLNATIEAYDPAAISADDVVLPDNTACDGLFPMQGAPGVTPSSPNTASIRLFDTIHGQPPLNADDKVLKGTRFYVARGCVAYTTFDSVHRSAFCYVLQMIPPQEAPAPATPAPPVSPVIQAGQTNFVFLPCAKGFSID